jgi:hypothetical protein
MILDSTLGSGKIHKCYMEQRKINSSDINEKKKETLTER